MIQSQAVTLRGLLMEVVVSAVWLEITVICIDPKLRSRTVMQRGPLREILMLAVSLEVIMIQSRFVTLQAVLQDMILLAAWWGAEERFQAAMRQEL